MKVGIITLFIGFLYLTVFTASQLYHLLPAGVTLAVILLLAMAYLSPLQPKEEVEILT